jgi:hypothetical protein
MNLLDHRLARIFQIRAVLAARMLELCNCGGESRLPKQSQDDKGGCDQDRAVRQVDGYAGYRKLADRGDVRLAFCWSHVRRRFYELATPGPSPIASEALEHIAALYAVEKDIRGRHADKRRTARQQRSRPLIDAIEPWLRAKLGLISQKSKLANAIR